MVLTWLREKGPKWLGPTSESQQETKTASELITRNIEKNNSLEKLLGTLELWKVFRPSVWINRFMSNCRKTKVRRFVKS